MLLGKLMMRCAIRLHLLSVARVVGMRNVMHLRGWMLMVWIMLSHCLSDRNKGVMLAELTTWCAIRLSLLSSVGELTVWDCYISERLDVNGGDTVVMQDMLLSMFGGPKRLRPCYWTH